MKNCLKQSTYTSYYGYINNHFSVIGNVKLKDLNSKLLQDFYNYKLNDEGLSPKTIINMNLCLHKALKQAVLDRYLTYNPCDAVNLPKNEKPQIEVMTREEQSKLIYVSYKFRYGIFVRLVLSTGIRMGELLGLKWEDIDMRTGVINIRRTLNRLPKINYNGVGNSTEIVFQSPKTKNSLRSIPLVKSIVEELKGWRQVQLSDAQLASTAYTDTGMLVTNQLGMYIEPRTFKDYYNQMLEASGIGHFTFHALRHTFATRALEQQMDSKTLSMILGHYSVSFTLDTYAHVLDSHKREGMMLMEELFTPPEIQTSQSYPVIVTPQQDGFTLNAVDFEDISVKSDTIEQGLGCIQSAISLNVKETYPPTPTPHGEIILNPGEFIVMVNSE